MEETFKKLKQIPMPGAWAIYVSRIRCLRDDPDFAKMTTDDYLKKLDEISQDIGYADRLGLVAEHNKHERGY